MTNPDLHEKLARLVRSGVSLSSLRDLDTLLHHILEEAMELSAADGASLYLVRGNMLDFHIARNRTLEARLGTGAMERFFERFEIPISADSMAGYCALTGQTLNFADVQKLPAGSDFRYNPSFDQKTGYDTHAMLTVPMRDRQGHCVGVLQLVNHLNGDGPAPFDPTEEMLVTGFAAQAGVAIVNTRLDLELARAHQETLFRLSSAAEYRDKETSNHIKRMSHFARIIAREIGLPREEVDLVFWSAPMHDVGKIGIPDHILLKPDILTPEERVVMQAHAVIGAHILKGSEVPVVRKAAIVALTHHEKWDGSGYPQRLAGEAIPLEGRIVALADVFDALSSPRCYKEPWPETKVLDFLDIQKGRHFEPRLVEAFVGCLDEIRQIQKAHEDTDEDFETFQDLTCIPVPRL